LAHRKIVQFADGQIAHLRSFIPKNGPANFHSVVPFQKDHVACFHVV